MHSNRVLHPFADRTMVFHQHGLKAFDPVVLLLSICRRVQELDMRCVAAPQHENFMSTIAQHHNCTPLQHSMLSGHSTSAPHLNPNTTDAAAITTSCRSIACQYLLQTEELRLSADVHAQLNGEVTVSLWELAVCSRIHAREGM